MKYIFRDRPLTIKAASKADAQVIGTALAKITEEANGRLTPKAVVRAAEAPKHPLHRHFEWDDRIAASAFRLDQARSLIRSIEIILDGRQDPAPAFLSVSTKGGTSYRTAKEVLGSVELQAAVLAAAERDLVAFEKRYRELEDVCSVVREAREKIADRRSKHESRVSA